MPPLGSRLHPFEILSNYRYHSAGAKVNVWLARLRELQVIVSLCALRYNLRIVKRRGERMNIEPPETIIIDTRVVACDGGDGTLGHPRVYLSLEGHGQVECPYCDRLYIFEDPAGSQDQTS